MGNYMGSFFLLNQVNPPFSLVYFIFFYYIYANSVNWVSHYAMKSNVCFMLIFGQFWDKFKYLMNILQPIFEENKGEDLHEGVPLIYDPYLESSFRGLGAQAATSMHKKGGRASEEKLLSISSLGSQASLILGELLGI